MGRKRVISLLLIFQIMTLTACGSNSAGPTVNTNNQSNVSEETLNAENIPVDTAASDEVFVLEDSQNGINVQTIDDKYRTFYEVFVYSFADSDDDGIGDLKGLTDKLDYISDGDDKTDEDLGANGIWLMPIMQSTTYHKYDVVDYYSIDKEYGSMEDFKIFMQECNDRDIHVILDWVMNHTSSENPWFKEACAYLRSLDGSQPLEDECKYFGYYNFSQEKKSEAYYPVEGTGWYYEGKFWEGMPDLNLYNENVRAEFEQIVQYWLEMGVSGFRLDAVKEFESDNTEKNVEILTWFHDMVKSKKDDAYLVGEAWTSADIYTKYYASGVDSFFDFQFANSDGIIANSIKGTSNGNAKSYGNAIVKVQDLIASYNVDGINAPFYTNHDLGRSAGYYSGDFSPSQTKIAQAMNLFMSGNAFLYYGEELGMKGSGKDENKRLAMYWSQNQDAEFMCHGPVDADSVKQKYDSYEEQKDDLYSIYSYVKNVIKIRNTYPSIARGKNTLVEEWTNEEVCAIRKTYEDEEIIIVFNISQNENTIDMTQVNIKNNILSEENILTTLLTEDKDIAVNGQSITLPAYSVVVIK